MPVTIRRAVPGDEPAVVRLVRELADDDCAAAVDEEYARRFLTSPGCAVLLACDADEAIGVLSFATVPGLFHAADSGLIEALVVTETRRGEGVGRALMGAAMRLLEEAGCAEISVSTGADNEAAQRLYFAMGLTEASVLLEKHLRR